MSLSDKLKSIKSSLSDIKEWVGEHPIITTAFCTLIAYGTYANRYELANAVAYPDRPGIGLYFQDRISIDVRRTDYQTVLVVPESRSDAQLEKLTIMRDGCKPVEIPLDGNVAHVQFNCDAFGPHPRKRCAYTVRVEDSEGNVGEKTFESFAVLLHVRRVEDGRDFRSIEESKRAARKWNNQF